MKPSFSPFSSVFFSPWTYKKMYHWTRLPREITSSSLDDVVSRIKALACQDHKTLATLPEGSYWALCLVFSYHQYPLDSWLIPREQGAFMAQWVNGNDRMMYEFIQANKEHYGHLLEPLKKVKNRDLVLLKKRLPHFTGNQPTLTYAGRIEWMTIFHRNHSSILISLKERSD